MKCRSQVGWLAASSLCAFILLMRSQSCCAQLTASSPEVLALAQAPAIRDATVVLSEPTPPIPPSAPAPIPGVVADIFPVLPGSFRTAASNAAVDWNIATQWVLRVSNATNIATRVFALTSLGIWQALSANENLTNPADSTAVAGYAAHNLLMNQFPLFFALYDDLLLQQLEGLPDSERERAKDIAYPPVVRLLASRLDDGFQDPQPELPTASAPGAFEDVGSGDFRDLQNYVHTKPLLLPEDIATIPFIANFTPPPDFGSNAYSTELTVTYLLGGNVSEVRSDEQTVVALFWGDGGNGTTGVSGHWNQLVLSTMPANITLLQSAEVLAKMNVAMFDTTLAVFYLKFLYNRWRPITAIRAGDMTHAPEPTWEPLLATPNNPSYPSGQGGFGGNCEAILADFYGTDDFSFSLGTEIQKDDDLLQSRLYRSFSLASAEVSQSRYFAGIENPSDARAGRLLGQQIGQYVLENFEELTSAA